MKYIIGEKLGMTQLVGEKGEIIPVTLIGAETDFSPGDLVKVSARSTGKGFQGVVKRHGFHGSPASHGHHAVLRRPGSIGGRFPQRVLKGKRMGGRTGGQRVTVKNLKVIRVDAALKVIAVRGAIPGKKGTRVEIRT
ncbi:MAG: 50S ribosomal protein L3 [Minisyncoccia bacterium]